MSQQNSEPDRENSGGANAGKAFSRPVTSTFGTNNEIGF